VVAEDRTRSIENPRTFLTTRKTFKKLDGFLDAAEQAGISDEASTDLHVFVQQYSSSAEGCSEDLCITQEELQRIGFPPLQRASRTYLVSIVPEAATLDSITVRATLQNRPPGTLPKAHERSLSRKKLDEILAMLERRASDLFDRRLGPAVPEKARFDAEDAHTLLTWPG